MRGKKEQHNDYCYSEAGRVSEASDFSTRRTSLMGRELAIPCMAGGGAP